MMTMRLRVVLLVVAVSFRESVAARGRGTSASSSYSPPSSSLASLIASTLQEGAVEKKEPAAEPVLNATSADHENDKKDEKEEEEVVMEEVVTEEVVTEEVVTEEKDDDEAAVEEEETAEQAEAEAAAPATDDKEIANGEVMEEPKPTGDDEKDEEAETDEIVESLAITAAVADEVTVEVETAQFAPNDDTKGNETTTECSENNNNNDDDDSTTNTVIPAPPLDEIYEGDVDELLHSSDDDPPFPIRPAELIRRAKDVVIRRKGGLADDGACLADDFVFRAQFVEVDKVGYLRALQSFRLESSFDITPRYYGWLVDPLQPNRVWFLYQSRAVHSRAPFMGVLPSGTTLELPPQLFHVDFARSGQIVELGFYTVDRAQGNTGGLGGAFAYFYGVGKALPFPEGKPYRKSWQWQFWETLGTLFGAV